MRILIGTYQLDAWAGSETYLLTLAEQLQRLGHETAVHAQIVGDVAQEAERRGIEVLTGDQIAWESPDGVIAQDAASSYALAAAYPSVSQLYVAHSENRDLQIPPQLPDLVGAIVAMNGRVARFVAATTLSPPIARLGQPVDVERFAVSGELPARARRAVLLGNYLTGSRLRLVSEACAAAGLEAEQIGAHVGTATADAASAIAQAHVVIGQGRVIIEAMACGRAAYVFDQRGSGGWVTSDSYAALAEDGFAGVTSSAPLGPAELQADFERYEPAMGPVNRALASAHHDARHHAIEVVALLRDLGAPGPRPTTALREMSRLVGLQWTAWGREQALVAENRMLREGRDRAEAEYEVLTAAHAETLAEVARTQELVRLRDQQLQDVRARLSDVEQQLRDAEQRLVIPEDRQPRNGALASVRRAVARLRRR